MKAQRSPYRTHSPPPRYSANETRSPQYLKLATILAGFAMANVVKLSMTVDILATEVNKARWCWTQSFRSVRWVGRDGILCNIYRLLVVKNGFDEESIETLHLYTSSSVLLLSIRHTWCRTFTRLTLKKRGNRWDRVVESFNSPLYWKAKT